MRWLVLSGAFLTGALLAAVGYASFATPATDVQPMSAPVQLQATYALGDVAGPMDKNPRPSPTP